MQSPTVYHIIQVSLTSASNILIKSDRMKCRKVIKRDSAKYRFFFDQAKAYMETTAGIEIVGFGEITDTKFALLSTTFATF